MKVSSKKKSTARSNASTSRAVAVALEDLNAKFDVFGEALQGVRSDVAELKAEVASLQLLRPELAAVREDVRVLRNDVAAVRDDVGVLRRDVELLKVAVTDNVREIKQLRKAQ